MTDEQPQLLSLTYVYAPVFFEKWMRPDRLSAQQGRFVENIPPTSAALGQHLLCAVFQADVV